VGFERLISVYSDMPSEERKPHRCVFVSEIVAIRGFELEPPEKFSHSLSAPD
jgi:hypothetical protein